SRPPSRAKANACTAVPEGGESRPPSFRLPFPRMAVAATQTFADRLAAEVERKRSQLVVGLDPNVDLMPVELRGDVSRFCCRIVDAGAPHSLAGKPQLAFFEVRGPAGMAAFDQVCTYARRAGLLVI